MALPLTAIRVRHLPMPSKDVTRKAPHVWCSRNVVEARAAALTVIIWLLAVLDEGGNYDATIILCGDDRDPVG